MRILQLWAPVVFFAVSGCADNRCSLANCEAAITGCRMEPAGMPNTRGCLLAGLSPPSPDAGTRYGDCVEACVSTRAGPAIECVAKQKDACLAEKDPTKRAGLFENCATSKTVSLNPDYDGCITACGTAELSCVNVCPTTSWDACYSCAKQCGQNWVACTYRC